MFDDVGYSTEDRARITQFLKSLDLESQEQITACEIATRFNEVAREDHVVAKVIFAVQTERMQHVVECAVALWLKSLLVWHESHPFSAEAHKPSG